MKIIRQLGTFLLGVTVGVGLYAVIRFWPLTPGRWSFYPLQSAESRPTPALKRELAPTNCAIATSAALVGDRAATITLPQIAQLPDLHQISIEQVERARASKLLHQTVVNQAHEPRIGPAPAVKVGTPAVVTAQRTVIASESPKAEQSVSKAAPDPTLFKAIGYVEKSDGQVEAIVMQENEVQVVHMGDEIAGRYRVTKITPETVSAVDETVIQVPVGNFEGREGNVLATNVLPTTIPADLRTVAKQIAFANREGTSAIERAVERISAPELIAPRAEVNPEQVPDGSLGYIEKADGKVEAVMADGDSVRLVPQTMKERTEVASSAPAAIKVLSMPGFRESLVSMSIAEVPVAKPPRRMTIRVSPSEIAGTPTVGDESSRSSRPGMVTIGHSSPVPAASTVTLQAQSSQPVGLIPGKTIGEASQIAQTGARKSPATYIFQTLGFVQSQNGEVKAIVADGAETYLVKKGEVFAGQYRATSVDPFLVLAVKARAFNPMPDFLAPRTDFGAQLASNHTHEQQFGNPDSHGVLTSGSQKNSSFPLFNTIPAGLGVQSYFFATDKGKTGY